jgi:hypothetical protein
MFMQDWDFPKFKRGGRNVKMMGCGDKAGCKSEKFRCKLTFNGKWINFTALIFLLVLDSNLFLNQALYVPADYDQLVDGNEQVHNVVGLAFYNDSYPFLPYSPNNSVFPPNATSSDTFVYCTNATTATNASLFYWKEDLRFNFSFYDENDTDHACYNISAPFAIDFAYANSGLMLLSGIPIVITTTLCFFMFLIVIYNGNKCNAGCCCCFKPTMDRE